MPLEVPPVLDETTSVATLPRPKGTLGELPIGLKFTTEDAKVIQVDAPTGLPLNPDLLADLPNSKDLASSDWSDAIIFAEDGSAMDAAWMVVDDRNQAVPVEVRGLTGAATIAPMFSFKDR